MTRRAALRFGTSVLTLWLAVTATFFFSRGTGDPAVSIAGENASMEQVIEVRRALGLDAPLGTQYVRYLGQLVTGDLGTSLQYRVSNATLVLDRLPATIILAALAVLVATVVGTLLGVLAAAKENTLVDRLVSALSLVGQSVPAFWMGLMAVSLFAVTLAVLPAGGMQGPASFILPVLVLSLLPLAQISRLTRSSMTETFTETYFDAGLARGLSRRRMIWRHSLRNSALPVLTVIGIQTGVLLSGAVTIEVVFAWPGIGTLANGALTSHDFTLVQSLVVVGALFVILVNLVVDLLYPVIDPRLRGAARV